MDHQTTSSLFSVLFLVCDFGALSLQTNIAVMIPLWFSPGLAITRVNTRKAENINPGTLSSSIQAKTYNRQGVKYLLNVLGQ